METGVAIIQEPVFTKTSVEEAPAGVLLDNSSMEVDKVKHSTVLDDEITSRDCGNKILAGEVEVAEVVNGSGNKETEEPEREKGEAMKTVSVVEDSKVVKEKASETEKNEQGSIFVHEPESFNPKIVLSDVTLEKEKEDDITRKHEEVSIEKPVIEEDQTETKRTPEQEEHIGSISEVLSDTGPVKVDEDNIEKSLNSAGEEISIKTDEVKEEKDSITVETSVNETETEHNATVSIDESSRNSENTVKDETEIVKTVVEEPEIVNHEETTGHESKSLKENAEPEKISSEVTVDKEKEEYMTRETAEVQASLTVIETPTIQGEDIESKASKDTEEHEHVVVRDIPQSETLSSKAETVETSTVQESAILKTLETKTDETEPEEAEMVKTVVVQENNTIIEPPTIRGEEIESIISPELKEESSKDTEQDEYVLGSNKPPGEMFVTESENLETKEDTKPIMDVKEDKEQEETKTVKTVISSDEVSPSDQYDVQAEELGEHTGPCSSEIKDEVLGKEESVEVKTKETSQEENTEEKHQDNKPETVLVAETESRDICEEIPSDLVLKVDKEELKDDVTKVDKVDGNQVMEDQRVVDSNDPEAEQIDRIKTEEIPTLLDVESVEQIQKLSLESHSEVLEETSKTVDEKIEEKPEEEVPLHQEGQEETEKQKPTNEGVTDAQQTLLVEEKPDEVVQVSSVSASEEREGETDVGVEKIADMKANEDEQTSDIIQRSLETVETTEIQEHVTVAEAEKVEEAELTVDMSNLPLEASRSEEDSSDLVSEFEEEKPKQVKEILEGDIAQKTEEVQESTTVTERSKIDGEDIESKASIDHEEEIDNSSKDTEEHEHVLVRDIPQVETLVTEAEAVETSTVQEDTKTGLHLKEDKEQVETEMVKNVISSDEVNADVKAEEFSEHSEPYISEVKDESHGGGESFEVKTAETVQEESSEKNKNLLDDKTKVDQVEETQTMEEQRGLDLNDQEAEQIYQKTTKETEEIQIAEAEETRHEQALVDVKSVEQIQKPSIESHSEVSEETSKTVDEKIEEKAKEGVTLHQESQEEGSNGSETKEVTISVPKSTELGVKAPEEESCPLNEKEKETKIQKEEMEKHEPTLEGVTNAQQNLVEEKYDEVVQVSSVSASEEREGEAVSGAKEIEDIKANEEEQVEDKIQRSLETVEIVEPHTSIPSPPEEHGTLAEAEKIEPMGDMREKGLEISETKDLNLPHEASRSDETESSELVAESEEHKTKQVKEIKERKEVVDDTKVDTIPQETLSDAMAVQIKKEDDAIESHEREEELSKAEETKETTVAQDEQQTRDIGSSLTETETKELADEHVDSSEKNDNETLIAETKKEDEDITVGLDGSDTSKTSENVCMKQEEFENLEAPKVEESKEDKSQEISETIQVIEATGDHTPSFVSELEEKIPKQIEEIHEEEAKESHKVEATSDQILPVETSQADNTPSSELVSEQDDQTPKQVKEIHEEETKEEHKLQAEEVLPSQITPRDSSDEALVSMLASREDDQVTLQEGISTTAENVCIKQEEFGNPEVPKLKESKEDKSQEISETIEPIEATGDHTQAIKKSEVSQTPSFISELEDKIPKQVEEIHEEEHKEESDKNLPVEASHEDQTSNKVEEIHEEEETKEAHKEESDKNLPVEASPEDQTLKKVEEIHKEEETKEAHKEEAKSDKNLPVETSQEHQTPSSTLVAGLEDQTPKQTEEIHEDEEIIPREIVPRESFSEAPVSMLASREDDQVQEGKCVGDTQEEQHISAQTLKSGEIIEEQDPPMNENSDDFTFSKETGEAEHGDETSSTLPVVGILTQLQTTLENERAINDSTSSEENLIKEPAEQVQKTEAESSGNDLHSIKEEPETLEKNLATDIANEKKDMKVAEEEAPASEIIEANKLQHDDSGETEKIHGLAEKSLPIEELKQEEHKEEVKVPEEETREIVEPEHVISVENQEERNALQVANATTAEKIRLQEEHPRDFEISKTVGDDSNQVIESELPADPPKTEQKAKTHETVKEEDQIVDTKKDKKNEEVQDEKSRGLYVTRESEEISSEVKKDKEDASELGVDQDIVPRDVEKEEINEVAASEKQITEPPSEAEKESNEEHVESQAILNDTNNNGDTDFLTEQEPKDQTEEVSADKSLTKEALGEQLQVPSSTEPKPSELISSHKSPIPLLEEKVGETSFEVKKAQEDKKEESGNDLITKENLQKNFEAPVTDKETSEQEENSTDLAYVQEDNGTNVKPDPVVGQKEETCIIEDKQEFDYVKKEPEDAIKHGVSIDEKNNATKEESKQTDTVSANKEEIREEEKETTQERFNGAKNTDGAREKTKPEMQEIENLSTVTKAQVESMKQKEEVPIRKPENLKVAEEWEQKDKESENIKDLVSEVKESEETEKEPARKSLSSLIEKVEGPNKIEDTTTKPHVKEEGKTEEEDEHEDEHKDDKTSPDSIVMVEAKDTVSIIKTQHKKGILSGVGSKVKHSISKVKKVLTGKSSHTTKPSSPK